ncbi:MAG: hypothetical protein JWM81_300 [Candidatus Saccharibacteria bacterium]|nr:hypothetical protein [Candidatus Saccharibacteria bacterium]
MNVIKADIGEFLKMEVSRREFLQMAGVAILSLIGITGFLNSLHKLGGTTTTSTARQPVNNIKSGYGR